MPPNSRERVGRALTAYLARSGEYAYSLDIRRQDANLDPVMDFLRNVKAGNCELFASSLSLMLRSQGVPARVVMCYRGADERSGDGAYVVRDNQAHAWVEIAVPSAASTPTQPRWDWLTLDATPAGDEPPPAPYSFWDWWQNGQQTGDQLWSGLVVDFNAERQADLWASVTTPQGVTTLAALGLGLPALVGACGLWWAARRRRRSRGAGRKAASPAEAGYARLLALLARHGGPRPAAGQTPREFAAAARRFLRARPAAAGFADLPDEMVDRFYQVRFGGRAAAPGESAAAEARLDQLAAALRAG